MYQLGNVVLPQPKRFERNIIEQAVEHLLIFGKTTKYIKNRKEQFVLDFQNLTQAQINSIISLYNLEMSLPFIVSEESLLIQQTDVLMDLDSREYGPTAEAYRENLRVILTEVI